jgi:outer membrane protein OmpA-like peptidoglycan-associated protein
VAAPLRRTRLGAREGVAAIAIVLALAACSTIDDLFDDDSPAPAASSKPGSYPNLQSVPNRPDRPTPPAGLSGDRGNARYTDSDVKPVNETANAVVGQTLSASAPQAPTPGSVATAPVTPPAAAPQSNAAPPSAPAAPGAPVMSAPVASAPMVETGPVGMPAPIPPSATQLILPSPTGSRAGAPIARAPGAVPTSVPVSGNLIEVAVVQFGRSSAGLNGSSLSVLRDVASIQRSQGGVVHVVGHASADSANPDPQRAKEDAYGISLARANAIARQLAALGVPRDRIVVEAAADDQPEYAPVTATAVAANRRAEIYLDL